MKFKLYIEPFDLPAITKYYSGQSDELNITAWINNEEISNLIPLSFTENDLEFIKIINDKENHSYIIREASYTGDENLLDIFE
jgi:hypothetical protein